MNSGDLLLLEGLGLGRVGRHVGVRELGEFPGGGLALKELVLGTGVGLVDELADKGLGLKDRACGVHFDVRVLDGGVSARDNA